MALNTSSCLNVKILLKVTKRQRIFADFFREKKKGEEKIERV